jgi:hypothetical protein
LVEAVLLVTLFYVVMGSIGSIGILGEVMARWQEVERERELRKEGRVVPSRVKLREGPINVTELHWAKPTMVARGINRPPSVRPLVALVQVWAGKSLLHIQLFS